MVFRCKKKKNPQKLFLDLIYGYDLRKKNYMWIPWILPSGLLFISLFSNILYDCAMLSVQLFPADI